MPSPTLARMPSPTSVRTLSPTLARMPSPKSVRTLSPRLRGVIEAIPPINLLADIGTDHAIVPIYACLNGICTHAIASDKNPGPLEIAKENAARHKLRISFALSDGLMHLAPGAADCIVIAGMGGGLIWQIISATPDVARGSLLILQPQSDVCALRSKLICGGYEIYNERLIREGNRFYSIICAKAAKDVVPWEEHEYFLGKKRLDCRDFHNLETSLKKRRDEIEKYLPHLTDLEAVLVAERRLGWIHKAR